MSEEHPGKSDEPGMRDHVEDVADGCGCTEVWEHLGQRRSEEREAPASTDD